MTDTVIAYVDGVETVMTVAEHEAEYGPLGVPDPVGVPTRISKRQFWQQLALDGDITKDEARAVIKTGTLPKAIQDAIDKVPDTDMQFTIEMLLIGADDFERGNAMVPVLGSLLNKSSADLDAIWVAGALL